jgi:hypothetical protein
MGLAIAHTTLGNRLIVVARKTEVCNLQAASIVDQKVGGLHVSVENVVIVEVTESLEQLEHVTLDLRLGEVHVGVVEQSRQIVVHVRRDHVENGTLPALGLGTLHGHLLKPQDILVGQHLQQLDLAQCGDGEAVLLVVHKNLLERVDLARVAVSRFVHLSKGALAEFLEHLILADL